ncbi:MAG: KTSC domain-containing protein [Alphaproteobacteria bacterium]|nr:MAG: KTSC domain-containing protein [Alphaproteobacteria bacterium]
MAEFNMIPVASSNIESIGYDEETQILRVRFLNGAMYEYKNLPIMEYEQLKNAPSVGSYFNRNIARNYPYEKVA